MSDTATLRPRFWELALESLTRREWEALCDGCGKCCLNKFEDEESGEISFTRVACRLLDNETCQCAQYEIRFQFVPECIVLTPKNIAETAYFMPETCAYRLRANGQPLPGWHYLLSGDRNTIHDVGMSVKGWTVPEFEVGEEDWEDYLIEEPI